jgi:hypothetical protein
MQLHESLLADVVRLVAIPEQRHRGPRHGARVALHQRPKRGLVARAGTGDEQRIIGVSERHAAASVLLIPRWATGPLTPPLRTLTARRAASRTTFAVAGRLHALAAHGRELHLLLRREDHTNGAIGRQAPRVHLLAQRIGVRAPLLHELLLVGVGGLQDGADLRGLRGIEAELTLQAFDARRDGGGPGRTLPATRWRAFRLLSLQARCRGGEDQHAQQRSSVQ